jgi:hypothetical protein
MKERPILFSTPMVRAILDGRKTQTRRLVSETHLPFIEDIIKNLYRWDKRPFPYGKKGDKLWVRETFVNLTENNDGKLFAAYKADFDSQAFVGVGGKKCKWNPSIFMPRWASRITLEIISVRVERLQEISEQDAIAEGIYLLSGDGGGYKFAAGEQEYDTAKEAYIELWKSINGADSWSKNPHVWVIEFKKI